MDKPQSLDGFYDINEIETALKNQNEDFWIERGERTALQLFHEAARRVPAYKDFLKKNKINPEKIKTIEDFKQVPTVDKDNYLKQYPREMLCWDGKFKENSWVISATSGSTDKPFYFPRTNLQDEQYALIAELYLRSNFDLQEKSTLYINAFAMGVWIGGVFTYEAIKRVAEKEEYSLSIINAGINKQEVVNAVQSLGKEFDQIIIGCYPPVLKDMVDLGINSGISWDEYDLGVIFSAEGFNEQFRDYILQTANIENAYKGTLNHYGTVDMGTMSHETPLTIFLRKYAINDINLHERLFENTKKLPTLTQYIPEMFYFEETQNKLLCTSDSGYPLIRYDLKDNGGIIELSKLEDDLAATDLNLRGQLQDKNLHDTVWNLPMVYVYERSDFSVSFLGFQVYPETIRKVLDSTDFNNYFTGKCTLEVDYDDDSEQVMYIHVEEKATAISDANIKSKLLNAIITKLNEENSEFRLNYADSPDKATPVIKIWPYEDKEYFGLKGKQKWIKNKK